MDGYIFQSYVTFRLHNPSSMSFLQLLVTGNYLSILRISFPVSCLSCWFSNLKSNPMVQSQCQQYASFADAGCHKSAALSAYSDNTVLVERPPQVRAGPQCREDALGGHRTINFPANRDAFWGRRGAELGGGRVESGAGGGSSRGCHCTLNPFPRPWRLTWVSLVWHLLVGTDPRRPIGAILAQHR